MCDATDVWLHVDAAYGGAAALVPEMRHVMEGVDDADSLVVNPHKWMFTPVDCSALYTRRPEVLRRAFALVPEYLTTAEDGGVHNLMDYGVQLGRRFRALKLWMVLRSFGTEGMAARIRGAEFAFLLDAAVVLDLGVVVVGRLEAGRPDGDYLERLTGTGVLAIAHAL